MNLTRRQFLGLAVAASVTPAWLRAANAFVAKPRPIGFSLYGMKNLPALDAIDHVARIGYKQIELCLISGFPTEPAKFSAESRRTVRERLAARGLSLSALLVSLDLGAEGLAHAANLETIKVAGELSHQLDPQNPPPIETVTGGAADKWDSTKAAFAVRLHDWAEAAASTGTTLCVKAHAGQAVNTPDRLLWIYRQVNHPSLALTYDYSHLEYAGYELEPTLRELRPYTKYICIKDLDVGKKPARFLLAGEGNVDYPHYFRLLNELNYVGPVVAEVSSQIHNRPGYDGVKSAEQIYATLRAAMQVPLPVSR